MAKHAYLHTPHIEDEYEALNEIQEGSDLIKILVSNIQKEVTNASKKALSRENKEWRHLKGKVPDNVLFFKAHTKTQEILKISFQLECILAHIDHHLAFLQEGSAFIHTVRKELVDTLGSLGKFLGDTFQEVRMSEGARTMALAPSKQREAFIKDKKAFLLFPSNHEEKILPITIRTSQSEERNGHHPVMKQFGGTFINKTTLPVESHNAYHDHLNPTQKEKDDRKVLYHELVEQGPKANQQLIRAYTETQKKLSRDFITRSKELSKNYDGLWRQVIFSLTQHIILFAEMSAEIDRTSQSFFEETLEEVNLPYYHKVKQTIIPFKKKESSQRVFGSDRPKKKRFSTRRT